MTDSTADTNYGKKGIKLWQKGYDSHIWWCWHHKLHHFWVPIGLIRVPSYLFRVPIYLFWVPIGPQLVLFAPQEGAGWRKCIGCLICVDHFPQKSPIINDSSAETDTQLVVQSTGWRRCIGCLIFLGHCPQKRSIINDSSTETDPQLKASYALLSLCSISRKSAS